MPKPPDELIEELLRGRRQRSEERPTRSLITQGKLSKEQVKTWVKQLHYYRVNVPRKELYILANCPVKEVRMELLKKYMEEENNRIIGGTVGPHSELWLRLGDGLGIARDEMEDFRDLCPEYRLLVDSWLNYARGHSWLEGVALNFDEDGGTGKSGEGMKMADALAKFYNVPEWALAHFTLHSELDIEHGSSTHELIRRWALSDEQQNGVRRAVEFKRAFIQMEDRSARIACRIDPQLFDL